MRDKLAYEWGIPIAISLLAVGARYCINADRASLTGIIRAAIIGIFVGMEVNLYLLDNRQNNLIWTHGASTLVRSASTVSMMRLFARSRNQ